MTANDTAVLLLAIYFLLILVFSQLKRSHLSSRTLHLFRAFFPSWRFFEDFDEVPTLFYRIEGADGALGSWRLCLDQSQRSIGALLLNGPGNHRLACGSLLQHLLADLEEADESRPEELEKTVSYQLTRNLVQWRIHGLNLPSSKLRYQFKVSGVQDGRTDDLLISPLYERAAFDEA